MPSAIIADDEPHLAEYLRSALAAAWPELQVVAVAGNGVEALAALEDHAPEIAFLDIRMPGFSGLEVALRLRDRPRGPRVVFVTAYDQYAVEAFEAHAADYLLKPVTEERLARTVARLRASLQEGTPGPELGRLLAQVARHVQGAPRYLRWIRAAKRSSAGDLTEQIAVADIVYVQADDKYTCVHARDGTQLREWLIRVPLSDLVRDLDPADFAQIHRSVIVNLHAVAGTRRDLAGKLFVRLRDHARELPVARQYAHLFKHM